MAAFVRRDARSLIERLRDEPQRFDLAQAARLAEAAVPGAVPLGEGFDPRREAVRLRGSLLRGFPAGDLEAWQPGTHGETPALVSSFLSLGGAFGPLPPPVSELALERARRGDTGLRDFLDIFNHRLLSLFLRAKRIHRPVLQTGGPESSATAAMLWALLGLATPGLRKTIGRHRKLRMHGFERALLDCAGLLNQRPVSPHAVERMVAHVFAVPVRTVPFVGRWLKLDPDQVTPLGSPGAILGRGAVLGSKVWDQGAAIRLEMGPMSLGQLSRLLPGGKTHAALSTLTLHAVGGTADVEADLILPPRQVPTTRLTARPSRRAPRLGWTSFLTTRPRAEPGVIRLRLTQPIP